MSKTEKIMHHLNKDIAKKLQASFGILLSNYMEIWEDNFWQFDYAMPDAVSQIRDSIGHSIIKLPDILHYNADDLEGYIKQLQIHKNVVIDMQRTLRTYRSQLDFLSHCNSHRIFLLKYDESPINNLNIPSIVTNCMAFTTEQGPSIKSNMRKAAIMSVMPVKMARELYYDYVRKSVRLAYDAMVSEDGITGLDNFGKYMARSQLFFKPTANASYGAYFPEVRLRISDIEKQLQDNPDITAEGLRDIEQRILNLREAIEDVSSFMLTLFEAINCLLLLSTYGTDIKYLCCDNFKILDVYGAIAENIHNDNKGAFSESINEILTKHLEVLIDELRTVHEYASNIKMTDLPQEDKDLLNMVKVRITITQLYFEHISDVMYVNRIQIVDGETPEERLTNATENLVAYIKETLSAEPVATQRLLKQYFLRNIMCVLSDDEFFGYLQESFVTLNDDRQRAAVAQIIGMIFAAEGYSPKAI